MIVSRSFIRVDRAWKVAADTYVLYSKPAQVFQGCNSFHGLSYFRNVMDRQKKQKSVKPVWRPVSTQSCSHEGVKIQSENPYVDATCDEKPEAVVQVQVVHCSTPGSVSNVQDFSKKDETVCETDELPCSRVTTLEEEGSTLSENLRVESVHSINQTEKHSISVEVAASLIRFIKGKWGSTQKQIEEETGVKIIFPSSKKENSLVIEGVSIESVTKASEKIQVILGEAVKSPNLDYSHFISLPLAIHPELVDKLVNFQNTILGNCDSSKDENVGGESDEDASDDGENSNQQLDGGRDFAVQLKVEDENEHDKVDINKISFIRYPPKASKSSTLADLGIERSIFIKPKTFHLTVLMLKLWNKERIAAATEVLQRATAKVVTALDSRPVFVRLKGLECMRGSMAKAQVLYAPVEVIGSEERLLHACQVITDAYVEAGLVLEKDARQKLKLHGTVMNARHRKRKKRTKRFNSFDARGIVKQYGSEEWGEYLIPEVHLSQRFVFDENGYYHCCASIPFPENKPVE